MYSVLHLLCIAYMSEEEIQYNNISYNTNYMIITNKFDKLCTHP